MSLKFLFKKGFHPARLDIQERIWKKEQEKDAEQKRITELKQRIEEEKGIEELRRLQEIAGGKNAGSNSLDWMYAGPQAQRKEQEDDDAEALLTGKRVIGASTTGKVSAPGDFDLIAQSAKLNSITQSRAAAPSGPAAATSGSSGAAAREAPVLSHREEARIRSEDPLVAMREREAALASGTAVREALLADPVVKERLKRLQEAEGGRQRRDEVGGSRSDRVGGGMGPPSHAGPAQAPAAWQGRRDNRPAWLVQQEQTLAHDTATRARDGRQEASEHVRDRLPGTAHSAMADRGGQEDAGRGSRSRSREHRHRRHRSRSREHKHRRRHRTRSRSRDRSRSGSRDRHKDSRHGDKDRVGRSKRHRRSRDREEHASRSRSRSTSRNHRRHRARSARSSRSRSRSVPLARSDDQGGRRPPDVGRGSDHRREHTEANVEKEVGRDSRVHPQRRADHAPQDQHRALVEEGEEDDVGALSDEEKGRSSRGGPPPVRYGLTRRDESGDAQIGTRTVSERPLGPGEAAIAAAKERATAALGRLRGDAATAGAVPAPDREAALVAMQAAARARVQEVHAQVQAREAERAQVGKSQPGAHGAGPGQAAPAFITRAAADAMGKVVEARYGSR